MTLVRALVVVLAVTLLGSCSGDDEKSAPKPRASTTETTTTQSLCDAAKDASEALQSGAQTRASITAKRNGWAGLAASLPSPYRATAKAIVKAYDASLAALDTDRKNVSQAFVVKLGERLAKQLDASVLVAKYVRDQCQLVIPGYEPLLK